MNVQPSERQGIVRLISRALYRARIPILTVAFVYFLSVLTGILMVHNGVRFAISYRDSLVSKAQSDTVIVALNQNLPLKAALLDFGGTLFAAVVDTVTGLGVIFSYPLIAYRGWVGGIVSIDSAHLSRLADAKEALYYLVTLVLQLIPYTLSAGAGVNVGLAFLKPKPWYQGEKWLGLPREAILDLLRIFILVVPLFLIASLWEFLMR
jgi:uncharacterized membrane protein SpoIIM required for sporulation